LVKENLQSIFPCLQQVYGIDHKEQQGHLLPKDSKLDVARPTDWDYIDRRMLKTAYKLSRYPQSKEVACTMGHRRVLEKFLRQLEEEKEEEARQENQRRRAVAASPAVALILEDDAKPAHVRFFDDADDKKKNLLLVEIVDRMKDLDWDMIQLGRCYDIFCDRHRRPQNRHRAFPVAVWSGGGDTMIRIYQSNGFELCSHAYLVSKKGAEKILQYSLPILLPYVSHFLFNM
jgi:hypothetical protein